MVPCAATAPLTQHKLAMLQRVLADVQARQAKEASRVPDRTAATDALLAKEASYQQVLASETKRLKRSGLTPEVCASCVRGGAAD
jgi:hypothetical protein